VVNKKQELEILVEKYLKGIISEDESLILCEHLGDPLEKAAFWEKSDTWQSRSELVERNWQELTAKIQDTSSVEKHIPARRVSLKPFLKYAAIALLALSLGATGMWVLITSESPSVALEKTIVETGKGEKTRLNLADGSKVWLNASSRLEIHQISDEFRQVRVEGEAYFEVIHNECPFVVTTDEYEIHVTGTKFNVRNYPFLGPVVTSLFEGKINLQKGDYRFSVKQGQTAWLEEDGFKVDEMSSNTGDNAWINNQLVFENTPFDEFIQRLEMWYDVEFIYNPDDFSGVNFTAVLKNQETVYQVLHVVGYNVPIRYNKIDARKIKIERLK
jgi:ferric-dicitrate binding protein FerR (iron transport regulator)